MSAEQYKICPRCNSKVSEDKDVCQQCGAILKNKPPLARNESTGESNSPARKCVICGKEPQEKATCPNCGVTGICSWHIYKFFSDNDNSPMGCPKCGPRCAVCGAQTTLSHHNERAVCASCIQVLLSSNAAREGMNRHQMRKIMQVVSVIITIVGIFLGVQYSTDPAVVKMVTGALNMKLDNLVFQIGGGIVGLVVGSFVGAIINNVFRV